MAQDNAMHTKKPSELQLVTRQYNNLLWSIKGLHGNAIGLSYRVPPISWLTFAPTIQKQRDLKIMHVRLLEAMQDVISNIAYVEILTKELSEAHRDAIRYTKALTTSITITSTMPRSKSRKDTKS